MVDEFKDRIISEKQRNKELGVYLKQGYSNNKKDEATKLSKEILDTKAALKAKEKKIAGIEERQLKHIHTITALDRFLEESKKEKKRLEQEIKLKKEESRGLKVEFS